MVKPSRAQHAEFRRILTEARKKAGLTQVELAKKVQRPQSFIAKYESGERKLGFIETVQLLKILKIDVTALAKKISVVP